MKHINKILVILILGLSTTFSVVEAQSINYKAVIKDGSGNLITNDLIQVQFNILQGVAQTNVYSETHTPTTDDNGIIIVNIGEGTLVSGSAAYSTIDWANDTHFLQVLVNTGDGFIDMGTSEFKAVPYAITSGDKVWEKDTNGAHLLSTNVGIGTNTPSELLEINDVLNAGIKLSVPTLASTTKIEFYNGIENSTRSFYKIENENDRLSFRLDTDLATESGFVTKMSLSHLGLRLESGTRINEFSTNISLSNDNDNALPTELAVKTYVNDRIEANNTKTILIPAVAFTSDQNNTFTSYRHFGAYAQKFTGTDYLFAPLVVPVGATVTSVTFYLRDESSVTNVNLKCTVLEGNQTAVFLTSVFSSPVSTFGGSSAGQTLTYVTPFTIAANNRYIIRVRPTSNWGPNDFGICSVEVTYTE